MIISFYTLLTSGKLGDIALGMDGTAIRALLGDAPPPAPGQGKYKRTGYQYGSLDLFYERDRLTFIGIYFDRHDGVLRLPSPLIVEGYFPHGHTSQDEIKHYLISYEIGWVEDRAQPLHPDCRYILTSGLSISFDPRSRCIYSVQLT